MMSAAFFPYTLRFKRPAGTSRGVLHSKETYFVRLAQGDAVGWGECGPVAGLSIDEGPNLAQELARICHAINAGQPPNALDLTELPSVAFALESALLDLETGGHQRLFDTPFARGHRLLPTHGLIWMDSVDGLLQQIEEKVARGYRVVKMKVGALPLAQECALLAAMRARFPADQIELRLDANGAFTPADALIKLTQLVHYDVHFLEQPIKPGQWQELAAICAHSPIPIGLDEELIGIHAQAERARLLDTLRPQHLIIKPTLLGGLAAADDWIALAAERGIGWWINSALESNVGLNAIAQWLAAKDDDRIHGLGTGQLFTNNIPSPIQLRHNGLIYDPNSAWDFTRISPTSTP